MKSTINLMGEKRLTTSTTGSAGRKIFFVFFLFILLFLLAAISVTVGSYPITVTEVYSIIWHGLFQNPETTKEILVLKLRLPRIFMGSVAGVALGLAGTIMQGVLKNPLASPYTLGVSSGAGFGAVLALTLGAGSNSIKGAYLTTGIAFLFAFITALFILYLANRAGATPLGIVVVVIVGIAMIWLFAPMQSLISYFGDLGFRLAPSGDLGMVPMPELKVVIAPILLACFVFLFVLLFILKLRDFDTIGIGIKPEKSPNIEVKHIRILLMAIASLFVASVISFTGAIAFIGLVAPHIAYVTVGKDNRFLLPASALIGALLVVGADIVARILIAPVILPVSTITALIGVPLFIYLLITMILGVKNWR